MPYRHCIICQSQFSIKPSHVQRRAGLYCSPLCASIARQQPVAGECPVCQAAFITTKSAHRKFCSKQCWTASRTTSSRWHTCLCCQKPFYDVRSKKYCSYECSVCGRQKPL